MVDSKRRDGPLQAPPLPPELEARIAAFEHAKPTPAFGLISWLWMIALGAALPAALLLIGWWA